ncbi:MAG: protease-like activity factor CPAF [Bdellovibrionota bacterium]
MKFYALSALALFSSLAHADTLKDDVIAELYVMKSVYNAEYAPAQWKKAHVGYDLDTNFRTALDAVQSRESLTIKESREIFKNFIYAMKDYHTSIGFTATEQASLAFTVKGAGDRFFLGYIDRKKLPEASFPFHVGDELVSFGGVSALQAVLAVQAEIPANEEGTDRAVAELNLTRRRAARGMNVPKGGVTLGILAKGQTKPTEIQLVWDYTAETIFPRGNVSNTQGFLAGNPSIGSGMFHPMMLSAGFDKLAEENPHGVGSRKTFTPALGAKIFETEDTNTFHAYIYKNAQGKLIGYLRLPSYVPGDYKKAVTDFAGIVTRFEAVTDSMVIDQVNNPGGSVFYLYALASMLSDQPLRSPLHHMSITQSDVSDALDSIKTLSAVTDDESARKALPEADMNGYPATYEFAQFSLNYARFIVSEWEAGRKLTRPFWIAGVDHINPAATHYTKPILLLINHLDFSGGDFFPTIMQDNKRATIMGSRTAGAGGYVVDVKVPNNVGVDAFRVTESIAERVDGNPIENLGVTPDILYEMTPADYTGNFAGYVTAIQNALNSITR